MASRTCADTLDQIIDAGSRSETAAGCINKIKISAVNIRDESRGTMFVALGPNDLSVVVKVITHEGTRAGEHSETGALCDDVQITSWGIEKTQDTTGVVNGQRKCRSGTRKINRRESPAHIQETVLARAVGE